MSELLPCPFCGGEAEVYEMQYGADGQYSVFGVFCVDDSKAELIGLNKYQHGHFIDNFSTKAEAIAAWNTRAERTCRDANTRFDAWTCSECKCTLLLMFDEFGEPTFNVDGIASVPNYCPNCGAKVVNE